MFVVLYGDKRSFDNPLNLIQRSDFGVSGGVAGSWLVDLWSRASSFSDRADSVTLFLSRLYDG